MIKKQKLSKGIRKYIRKQKAEIRRRFSDHGEIEGKIKELMQKFLK